MYGLIAIGDIHGHLEKLVDLMNQVKPTAADQLVFLGDYIDRGPDSKGVIDYLMSLQRQYPETVFIRGNHDQLMLDALHETAPERLPADWLRLDVACPGFPYGEPFRECQNTRLWLLNGGHKCLESFSDHKNPSLHDVPQEYVDFLIATKLWYRQSGFLFVHAGADEDRALENQIHTLLWEQNAPPGTRDIHVVGHRAQKSGQPLFEEGRYYIDTGAYRGRPLTACDVLTKQVWQAI